MQRIAETRAMSKVIRRALDGYGIRTCDLVQQPGTKGVATLRVSSGSGGEYVLKLHPNSPENLARIRSKLVWMEDMSGTGLNVPAPIRDASGGLASSVASSVVVPGIVRPFYGKVPGIARASRKLYDERVCELLSWVPGVTAKGGAFGWRKARIAGCQMAMMHDHAERYSGVEELDTPFVGWEETFGEDSPLWSRGSEVLSGEEMRMLCKAADRVRKTTQSLGRGRSVFGPIHGDPTLGNVVFDGTKESLKASFIDFDDFVCGYYLMDVGIFLDSLGTFTRRRAPLTSAFLRGYRCIREIPDDMENIIADLRVLHHASAMAWRLRSGDIGSDVRDRFRRQIGGMPDISAQLPG